MLLKPSNIKTVTIAIVQIGGLFEAYGATGTGGSQRRPVGTTRIESMSCRGLFYECLRCEWLKSAQESLKSGGGYELMQGIRLNS